MKFDNIMMDASPLYDGVPAHPIDSDMKYDWSGKSSPKTRTRRPVKYYFIDFDLCHRYDGSEPLTVTTLALPRRGGQSKVPEFESNPGGPWDPFPVDVFRLGATLRNALTGESVLHNPSLVRHSTHLKTLPFRVARMARLSPSSTSYRGSLPT